VGAAVALAPGINDLFASFFAGALSAAPSIEAPIQLHVGSNDCILSPRPDTVLGFTGLTQPPSYPEPEFGWLLTEAAEGRGVATEAARALMDWTWGATDLRAMVSYIDPRNAASIRVAEKLGGLRDDGCARPDDNPLVYRHRRPA